MLDNITHYHYPPFTFTYQLGLGQEILVDVTLQVNKALQGQRIYFFPDGGGLIG